MSRDKVIEFAKRYAIWAALVLSIVASWYVSQEDVQDDITPEVTYLPPKKINQTETTASLKEITIPFEWKLKSVSVRPVLDLFVTATAIPDETALPSKNIGKQSLAAMDPALTFNFNYVGQVEKNGLQSVFLMDENQKMLVIPVGGVVNPDWQLMQLDDNIMTVKHTGTGKSYQLNTRLTE
jgi:hypothetical protein